MKKVININFQGRVIPIEEPAYEELRNYTESLRRHFAREEGRDEIINDIENRIAELFTENLRKTGAGCITEADLQQVIGSIGRPEDFEKEDAAAEPGVTENREGSPNPPQPNVEEPRGAFYRNSNDKVLGGVCSGLAHYLRIDATIVRLLFALISLGYGAGFLIYIVLWIVLPGRELSLNIRRRLFRNPDQKVLGGVCSGLAAYFNIAVWIPRLVFVSPVILGLFVGSMLPDTFFWFPGILSIPFSGTLSLVYIILWIVVPAAVTASEKLEMRGEKVDLESIRNTVQEELGGLKDRARNLAPEAQARVQAWGKEVGQSAERLSSRVGPTASRVGNGIGRAIGILFKVFFLFLGGIVAFTLLMILIAILIAFAVVWPLSDFFLHGFWQNFTGAGTVLLFFAIPFVAIVVWLIRRIIGIKSRQHYLGWIFAGLWIIGWVCLFSFASMKGKDFSRPGEVENTIPLQQPSGGRMRIELGETPGKYYPVQWINDGDAEVPLLNDKEDSLLLNTVKISISRSPDSLYHLRMIRRSRGTSNSLAEELADGISFPIDQQDSILRLPKGFPIAKSDGFHNQQVILVLQVPDGKSIYIDEAVDWFGYFDMDGVGSGINIRYRREYGSENLHWKHGVWYIMRPDGLEKLFRTRKEVLEEMRDRIEQEYREQGIEIPKDSIRIRTSDSDTLIDLGTDDWKEGI